MKIFVDNKWRKGFLDYYRSPNEYRIKVLAFKNLEKLDEVYFVRPKSLKMLLNYLKKIGITAVLTKIKSRLQEKYRNEKYISLGIGIILESANETKFPKGTYAGFIAPLHPALVERISLPGEMLVRIEAPEIPRLPADAILYFPLKSEEPKDRWWLNLAGWSIYSGRTISDETVKMIEQKIYEYIKNIQSSEVRHINISEESPIAETKIVPSADRKRISKKTAVLFGYGNYAKSVIAPYIAPYLEIAAVHEIDPTQIYSYKNINRWDTSPLPRHDEKYDVFLIAGYHHTHTPLTVKALEQGAYAVAEKPIAVTENQLEELLEAVKKRPGRFFAGYHKRYSPFNKWAIEDLKIQPNEPISFHCIAYEVPYPRLHWYNWLNSKGPILANGCHWIDHFLYLNNFIKPLSWNVSIGPGPDEYNKTVDVSIVLANGAYFTMTLTHKGGKYQGVQDYVELRTDTKTIKLINDSQYIAEDSNGIIRKKKINKMFNYQRMYAGIGEKIAAGEDGDSLKSIEVSNKLILALEKEYQGQLNSSI